MNPGDVADKPPGTPYEDEHAKAKQRAWDAYWESVCRGDPKGEAGTKYWAAVAITEGPWR